MPRQTFFIAVVIAISISVAGLLGIAKTRGGQKQQVLPEKTAESTSTATPSITPSPVKTIDYSVVYPVLTQAAAANALALAQERLADAESTIAAAAGQQVRATEQGLLNSLMLGTPTAIARATAQAEQTAQALASAETARAALENAMLIANIEKEKTTMQQKANIKFALYVTGLAILLIIALFVVQTIAYRAQVQAWMRKVDDSLNRPLQNLAPVQSGFIHLSPSRSDTAKTPIDPETFAVWAERMLQGETAGINKWEGKDSPFYGKRASYAPFLAEMERRGYVADVPGRGKVLTDIGRSFCSGWLKRRTPPPPAEEVYKEQNGMIHAMPYPNKDNAEGEQ